jgi:hypothetical protein
MRKIDMKVGHYYRIGGYCFKLLDDGKLKWDREIEEADGTPLSLTFWVLTSSDEDVKDVVEISLLEGMIKVGT